MIAIIYDLKTQSTYISPIFAIKRDEVIAFNADRSGVKRIKMWLPYGVYIISGDDFDHQSGKWRGYEWVIENKALLGSMKYGRTASLEDFPEFKNYDEEIVLPEWLEITDKDSITSFMNTSNIFHEAAVKNVERNGNEIDIRIKSELGCYFNMRFIDFEGDCNIENNCEIDTSEITYEDGYYTFLMDEFTGKELYIKCKKILWNIEVILPQYLRTHDRYPDISALYEDISLTTDLAELVDGKLIINGEDKIEAELKNGEYVITVNGKRERGSVEDQDIYYHLLEYYICDISTPPETLWKFSHGRLFSLLHGLKHILFSAFFLSFCILFLATAESVGQIIFSVILCGIIFWVFVLVLISVLKAKIEYKIFEGAVSISGINEIKGFSFKIIDKVELKPSRIFKNRATINLTANGKKYYLRFITGADEAYKLICERINDNHETKL